MIPTISQVCSLNSSLPQDFEAYAAGKCRSVEIWLTKLETYLQRHTLDDLRALRDRHELRLAAASYQGGLLTSQGERRNEAWRLFEGRLELCRQLAIPVMVVAADIGGALTQQDLERAQRSLEQIAVAAHGRGVRVALEFQARASFCNNLQTAAALAQQVGNPALGLCLDMFHFFTGPSKLHDLGLLTAENLFHVQLCDVADVARELAADADRILPGDGDFTLEPILRRLREINYLRAVSLELMNPQIWRIPALQLGEIGMTALRKVLGQAET